MTNLSGLDPASGDAKRGAKFKANWRARYFLADKRIEHATIIAVYKGGFTLRCHQALAVGAVMNLEFVVNYKGTPTRVRLKAKADYCLIPSNASGADVDVVITQLSPRDLHVVNNLLQLLSSGKRVNLRI